MSKVDVVLEITLLGAHFRPLGHIGESERYIIVIIRRIFPRLNPQSIHGGFVALGRYSVFVNRTRERLLLPSVALLLTISGSAVKHDHIVCDDFSNIPVIAIAVLILTRFDPALDENPLTL